MIIQAIYAKEWLKLKWYLIALAVTAISSVAYFWFDLNFKFSSIEPASMMWYRFAQIGDKPYDKLAFLFLFSAVIIAVAQFLPETIRNRVRILTHLPCRLQTIVAHHLVVGGLGIVAISTLAALLIVLVMKQFYPLEIVQIAAKDCFFWSLLGLALYLGLSGAIIERNFWRKSFKLLVPLVICLLYFKSRYTGEDTILAAIILWLTLLTYDSFLSVKVQRLQSLLFKGSIAVICLFLLNVGVERYQDEYASHYEKYYLFFSPTLRDFVYQENNPGHNFVYGTTSTTFDRLTYEENLPFVYWKNLDIQRKLPIQIGNESFDKASIRMARQSLQYRPDYLQSKEVSLYPLFNPSSDKGVIPFPEEAFALKTDRIVVYECETVTENTSLSDEINRHLQAQGITFPIENVWGKTTNMKPFDWGYFLRDSRGKIFNLRRSDNKVSTALVPVPEDVSQIVHIRVAENRLKNFYGYAVDSNNQVYLLSYPDYRFIPLELKNFNYLGMKFHLIADPMYYMVRYDDYSIYRAALFDKRYNPLATTKISADTKTRDYILRPSHQH